MEHRTFTHLHTSHTYGYAYGTESSATRRPRVPFPKSTSREPANPGGLQTEKWPKKERNERRSRVEQDDGGPCTSAKNEPKPCLEVLGLASRHSV